jgi:hypothetical protein
LTGTRQGRFLLHMAVCAVCIDGATAQPKKQTDPKEVAIVIQILRDRVRRKWRLPAPQREQQPSVVTLRLRFNENGTLSAPPQVIDARDSAYFKVESENAISAVMACQPFAFPRATYDVWKDVILRFDATETFELPKR